MCSVHVVCVWMCSREGKQGAVCYLGSRRAVWGVCCGWFWAAGLPLELMGGCTMWVLSWGCLWAAPAGGEPGHAALQAWLLVPSSLHQLPDVPALFPSGFPPQISLLQGGSSRDPHVNTRGLITLKAQGKHHHRECHSGKKNSSGKAASLGNGKKGLRFL